MVIENLDKKKHFYQSLNERQKRHYAAQLAFDLGHGGIKEVSEALSIDPKTVRRGMRELESEESLPWGRVRKEGGGRKKNDKRCGTHKSIYRGNRRPHSR